MAIEDSTSVQASIICLCRYAIFCFSTSGSVRWQIRLETVGTALMVYNVGSTSGHSTFSHLISSHSLVFPFLFPL
uniref:PHTB1_N domain-containing protein n=1 Tax=Angiostrongylus cantonensis TaxID=6313 RepID=A0A0K0DA26_ANGCA